jgi:hypothetical protein
MSYQWTPKVTARRELAELLQAAPDRVAGANLLPRDLELIIAEGRKAEEADAEQKEQLTDSEVRRSERKNAIAALIEREGVVRGVASAAVHDLRADHPREAEWLSRLSFARFRLRELAPPAAAPAPAPTESPPAPATPPAAATAEEEEIVSVERVEREDQVTRARNQGRYCRALLRPGREVIVAAFAERGVDGPVLERLATDAEAFAKAGRNRKQAVEATEREAEAAKAQMQKWMAVRRLVKKAIRGDKTLEAKYPEC